MVVDMSTRSTVELKAQILRLPAVLRRTGIGRTTLWDLIRKQKFPTPIKLGSKSIGFVESEVDEWIVAKIEERNSASRRQS